MGDEKMGDNQTPVIPICLKYVNFDATPEILDFLDHRINFDSNKIPFKSPTPSPFESLNDLG